MFRNGEELRSALRAPVDHLDADEPSCRYPLEDLALRNEVWSHCPQRLWITASVIVLIPHTFISTEVHRKSRFSRA